MSNDLDSIQAEVLRKVGRNIVLLQYLERLLKSVLNDRDIAGYANELPATYRRRKAQNHKQTMGQLATQYRKQATNPTYVEPAELKDVWISISFTIDGPQDEQGVFASLSQVVAERNELIHHFLSKWDMRSSDSGKAIEAYLDQQRDTILPIVRHLASRVQAMHEMKRHLASVLADPDFLQHFLDGK